MRTCEPKAIAKASISRNSRCVASGAAPSSFEERAMTIVIGADHAGFDLKNRLKTQLAETGHDVVDVGPANYDADDDYPDAAERLGRAILDGQGERGILICGSGVGASVAANKLRGIRAGLCHDTYSAHQGVEHDNINVLVLGSRVIGEALAWDLAVRFLEANFSGEARHVRRLGKIAVLEA
jgi:RpiB/LacA/LacB family sugar-phosphate isomerase